MPSIVKFYTVLWLVWTPAAMAQTAVGSGGDIVQAFVEEARQKYRLIVERLISRSEDLAQLCADAEEARQQSCLAYLGSSLVAQLELHRSDPVELVLSYEPLYVNDRGRRLRVAAATQLGPDGPILFDYELIASYSPRNLVALIGHETGHKVPAPSDWTDPIVDDGSAVPGYRDGRAFLDDMGLRFAAYASDRGMIGEQFQMIDRFTCEIAMLIDGEYRTVSHQPGERRREFSNHSGEDRYSHYMNRLGPVSSPEGTQCVSLQVLIHEDAGCDPEAEAPERRTTVELTRHFPETPQGEQPPPELLSREVKWGRNPSCSDENLHPREALQAEYRDFRFRCSYRGAYATTHRSVQAWSGGVCPELLGLSSKK